MLQCRLQHSGKTHFISVIRNLLRNPDTNCESGEKSGNKMKISELSRREIASDTRENLSKYICI